MEEAWKIKNFVPFHVREMVYNKIGVARIFRKIDETIKKWMDMEISCIVRTCHICYNYRVAKK